MTNPFYIATDTEICQRVSEAISSAESKGSNWADAVDLALRDISVAVDGEASRAANTDGYGPVCVLADGRSVWFAEDSGNVTIED